MKKTQELMVIDDNQKNAVARYTGALFSDIDFDGLNKIIDRISDNKEELTDGMRAQATQFADDWDKLVVARLSDKKLKLDSLTDFFTSVNKEYCNISCYFSGRSRWVNGDYVEDDGIVFAVVDILRALGREDYANTLEELNTKYEELEQRFGDEKPDRDDYFLNEAEMSFNDRIVAQKKFELAEAKFDKEESIAHFEFRKEFIAFRKSLMKDKKIADFVATLKAQLRQAKNAQALVHEKSSMVKLAINFGGTDLLKALQELHEFQKGL